MQKLTKTFSLQMLKVVPPAINKISLKNGDRLIAVAGASKIAKYHSAFEALLNFFKLKFI